MGAILTPREMICFKIECLMKKIEELLAANIDNLLFRDEIQTRDFNEDAELVCALLTKKGWCCAIAIENSIRVLYISIPLNIKQEFVAMM